MTIHTEHLGDFFTYLLITVGLIAAIMIMVLSAAGGWIGLFAGQCSWLPS